MGTLKIGNVRLLDVNNNDRFDKSEDKILIAKKTSKKDYQEIHSAKAVMGIQSLTELKSLSQASLYYRNSREAIKSAAGGNFHETQRFVKSSKSAAEKAGFLGRIEYRLNAILKRSFKNGLEKAQAIAKFHSKDQKVWRDTLKEFHLLKKNNLTTKKTLSALKGLPTASEAAQTGIKDPAILAKLEEVRKTLITVGMELAAMDAENLVHELDRLHDFSSPKSKRISAYKKGLKALKVMKVFLRYAEAEGVLLPKPLAVYWEAWQGWLTTHLPKSYQAKAPFQCRIINHRSPTKGSNQEIDNAKTETKPSSTAPEKKAAPDKKSFKVVSKATSYGVVSKVLSNSPAVWISSVECQKKKVSGKTVGE